MTNIIYSILYLFSVFNLSLSVQNQQLHSLEIEAEELKNSDGVVVFLLYNSEKKFPETEFKNYLCKKSANIKNGRSNVTFLNLPADDYAIIVFHDENNDGRIDKRLFVPKEGIGFSNYKSISLLQKPSYNGAHFLLTKDLKISVKVNYIGE